MDTTIIYYSANRENEKLRARVRETVLENSGGLPIISVSRKPIDFGENICVGEQPVCIANIWRQILVGLRAAQTRFAITVEDDTLYPAEYFRFTPPVENQVYRYDNIWILYLWTSRKYYGKFWHKTQMEGAQICGRAWWIEQIESMLDGDDWQDTTPPGLLCEPQLPPRFTWHGETPVLTCKTMSNLHRYTTRSITSTNRLLHWGNVEDVQTYLGV